MMLSSQTKSRNMSSAPEQLMRCSELTSHPNQPRLTPHHQQPVQAEVWGERGEGDGEGEEAQFAKSLATEAEEVVARQPRLRLKTVLAHRAKVQMANPNMSKMSCPIHSGNRLPMAHAGCHRCVRMGSIRASKNIMG